MTDNTQQQLFEAILLLQSQEEASKFFADLCTPAELAAMAERWRVVVPLKQGMSYRQIHQQTGVSVTTIGRVARAITYGSGGYEIVYNRLKMGDDND